MSRLPFRSLSKSNLSYRSRLRARRLRIEKARRQRVTRLKQLKRLYDVMVYLNKIFNHIYNNWSSGLIHSRRSLGLHSAEHSQKSRQRAKQGWRDRARQLPLAPIRASLHAILRWGERAEHEFDRRSQQAALSAILVSRASCHRGCGQREAEYRTAAEDRELYLFLAMNQPEKVAAWKAALLNKVEQFQDWPLSDFDLVDSERRLRLIIRNRVVLSVVPLPAKIRRR